MEQECVYDINELLLENPNLFTLSEQDALTTITTQLKVSLTHLRLTALGVLCCFAVCLTLLALFFLPSFSSLINMYSIYTHCLLW